MQVNKPAYEGHHVGKPKRLLANLTQNLFVSSTLRRLQKLMYKKGFIRVVNYHNMPRATMGMFEQHLAYYQKYYSVVSYEDVSSFLQRGTWHKEKPGLIISFDDGLRCHYEIGAPLVEKYGFIGWFFIPTGFVEAAVEDQQEYASTHNIKYTPEFPDPRVAMSWEELNTLAESHVVGSHTHSHYRFNSTESGDKLCEELTQPKEMLEHHIQREVTTFSWVGGEESSYSTQAAKTVVDTGYRFSFGTSSAPILPHTNAYQLHRTNVESSWPMDVVRFQLSGLIDLRYRGKRKRVDSLTTIEPNESQGLLKQV